VSSAARRVARAPAWVLAAVLAAGYLLADPRTSDLAAQDYRAGLFARAGFVLWDNGWYSGHHVPAYSLLFPPLGAWLGVQVSGALSAVALTWAWQRLVGPGHRLASAWVALASATLLVSGRLTFALGVALGLGALAAARRAAGTRGRTVAALVLAALSSAASPVAGLFLALAVAAWWLGAPAARRATTVALAAAALAPAAVLSVLFPEGGTFPFVLSSLLPALALTLLVWWLLPREERVLRAGAALTAALLVASWALPTPMGGNAVRVGVLFGGPVLALALLPAGRRRTLLLAAPALLAWQLSTPVDDWRQTAHDPAVQERAAGGLERFLHAQGGPPFRVEVPFTDSHWEADNLAGGADGVPLARGWERQYDRKVNALFYDGRPLTASRYRGWLDSNAVRFVALARAPVDYSAAAEAQLVRDGLPFLRRVYADRVWTAWEVRRSAPLGVTALTVDGFRARAGRVRIRWSPWFEVVAGAGCVHRDAATGRVVVSGRGELQVRARLGVGGLLGRTEHCRHGA
jgi:hypothetical protein